MYAARLAFSVCSAPPAATLTVGSLPGHCLGVFSFDPRCSLTVRAQQETVSLQLDLSKADGHPLDLRRAELCVIQAQVGSIPKP